MKCLYRKSHHTTNHLSDLCENWFSEQRISFKRIHLMFKYIFVLFRPISIKSFGADLHKNLLSVYNLSNLVRWKEYFSKDAMNFVRISYIFCPLLLKFPIRDFHIISLNFASFIKIGKIRVKLLLQADVKLHYGT